MPLTWDLSRPGAIPPEASSSSSTQLPAASSSGHIPVSTPELFDPAQTFEPADFDAFKALVGESFSILLRKVGNQKPMA
jgi:hypothetical protein